MATITLLKGTKVKVGKPSDSEMNLDFMGKKGIIKEINENGATGNHKGDPLYQVEFEDGSTESFWLEELIILVSPN
jgi:hypothetical protein